MESRKMELNQEQAEQISGGENLVDFHDFSCNHKRKQQTGNRRIEVDEGFFLSTYRVMVEYHCPDCNKTFWKEES